MLIISSANTMGIVWGLGMQRRVRWKPYPEEDHSQPCFFLIHESGCHLDKYQVHVQGLLTRAL